jgi:subtilase family serine protease
MSDTYSKQRAVVSRRAAIVAAGLFAFTIAVSAQTQTEAVIPNRITQVINSDVRVTLQNNVHLLAQSRYDQGAAPGSMATGRIMLVLKRSDAQELALRQYLADLQNPNSANYRKWLSPAQLGAQYGISDADLTIVTAWLQSQGFTVEKVAEARNVIIFSGNMAQIEQAFHTSIHKYVINGETHFSNSTDPQIPAALAPVIAGIGPLNDFHPRRGAGARRTAHFDSDSKKITPDLTLLCNANGCSLPGSGSGNILFTVPADAAIIYDTPNSTLNPKYSGTSYDGTGVTIGIAGDANINAQDIANYRAGFLPSSYGANQPKIIVDGNDPGINGDSIEALLDLEVFGGIAPGATVNLYTAVTNDLQDGLLLAIYRALGDNKVSILNVSFGLCEAFEGTSGNATYSQAWEQAAAQGISVTVSTGDSGSAGCDNSNTEMSAQYGLAVNGIASTPYNIAVGGTDYDVLADSFSTYVNSSNAASRSWSVERHLRRPT